MSRPLLDDSDGGADSAALREFLPDCALEPVGGVEC